MAAGDHREVKKNSKKQTYTQQGLQNTKNQRIFSQRIDQRQTDGA